MLAGPPLPFADFLEALRCKGLPIGLREHQAVARLLAQFSGGDPIELGDALAVLLAASPDEARLIRELFRLHYADALRPVTKSPPPPSRPQSRALVLQLGLGLLCVLLLLVMPAPRPASQRPAGPEDLAAVRTPDGGPGRPDLSDGEEGPEPQPASPLEPVEPARDHSWPRQIAGALIPPALIAGILYLLRRRAHRRHRLREQLRDQLEKLPGPSDYQLVLRDLRPPLPSDDLEDVATVLARLTAGEASGGGLDVRKTVERSLHRSPLIELVFAPRFQGHPLVILQDTGPAMRLWTRKVEAFIQGMAMRGVAVERYSFDPDPTQIYSGPDAPLLPLAELVRRAADSPLLIISTGAGAVTLLGQLKPWVQDLRRWPRRAWLHPLNNPSLWHPALAALPCNVWPMNRDGLLGASYDLAHDEDRRSLIPRDRLRPRRDVTPRDVERLKRLVALVPYAGLDLAELLRQRYAPEVPEEVLLHLVAHGTDYSGTVLRWALPELSRLLDGLRRDRDVDEETARRGLIELLDESEPPAGSLAHLRWRLDRAMQEVYLHDDAGTHAEHALSELKALAHTEILEEVDEALGRLAVPTDPKPRGHAALPIASPVDPRIQREVTTLIRAREHGEDAAVVATGTLTTPPPAIWPLPGLREIVVALVLPILLLLGIRAAKLGSSPLPNDDTAFTLEWLPPVDGKTSEGGSLQITLNPRYGTSGLAGEIEGLPTARRFAAFRGPSLTVPLTKQDLGHWVRARAVGPDRRIALSPQIEIPGRLPDGSLLVVFRSKLTGAVMPAIPFTAHRGQTAKPGISGQPLVLRPGQWRITADIPEHGRWNTIVNVDPATRSERTIDVSAEHGLIEPMDLPPHVTPADVRISGTPWDGKPLKVQPGPVEIAIVHDYYDYKATVDVKANEHKKHSLNIMPTHGVLELTVDPPFTNVAKLNKAQEYSRIPGGSGTYRLRYPAGRIELFFYSGGEGRSRPFDIKAGKTLNAYEHYEPKPEKSDPPKAEVPKVAEKDQAPDLRMPQECKDRNQFGPLRVGSVVILGKHRLVQGDPDWNTAMDQYVGKTARVTKLDTEEIGGACPVVRVDVDNGKWGWRIRDLKLSDIQTSLIALVRPLVDQPPIQAGECRDVRKKISNMRIGDIFVNVLNVELRRPFEHFSIFQGFLYFGDRSSLSQCTIDIGRKADSSTTISVLDGYWRNKKESELPVSLPELDVILINHISAWRGTGLMAEDPRPFDMIIGCWGFKFGKNYLILFSPVCKKFYVLFNGRSSIFISEDNTNKFHELVLDEIQELILRPLHNGSPNRATKPPALPQPNDLGSSSR